MSKPALRRTSPEELTIRRRRHGKAFRYLDEHGETVTDPAMLRRIQSLGIPPAYSEVRIAARGDGHLQAVGRDDAGRTQYRYHPEWETVREGRKVERIAALCAALPRLRRRIARDLRRPSLDRQRVLAAVAALIDRTHIRIGCEDYVHSGRSRGAATLLKRNARRSGSRVRLAFRGKGRRVIRCEIEHADLARTVSALKRLPGARLFQYVDDTGRRRRATAADANAYLCEAADAQITAKDFRTLAATAAAAEKLARVQPEPGARARRRQVAAVVKEVSEMLGNTPAVTRKSYVHESVLDAFAEGELARLFDGAAVRHLSRGETAVGALLRNGRNRARAS